MPFPIPVTTTLGESLTQILEHITPVTQDQVVLNLISRDQLENATWRTNAAWRDTSDANLLAPKRIYELTTNNAWRFPPFIRCEFTISTETGCVPQWDIDVRFGVPQYVQYMESKKDGTLRDISRPQKGAPAEDFGKVQLTMNGETLDYELSDVRTGKFHRRSAPVSMYRKGFTVPVTGSLVQVRELMHEHDQYTVLRRYDPQSRTLTEGLDRSGRIITPTLPVNSKSPAAQIVLHRHAADARLDVEARLLDETPGADRWLVTVTLHNNQPYDWDKVEAWRWRPLAMLMPHLLITVTGAKIDIGPQQHNEVLRLELPSAELGAVASMEAHARSQESWLDEYSHTNAVLTRSTRQRDTLILAPFGVYDTVRVQPVMEGSLRWTDLAGGAGSLPTLMTLLSPEERAELAASPVMLDQIHRVLRSAMLAFGRADKPGKPVKPVKQLRLYQWHAIQKRIQQLLAIRQAPAARRTVRVIRAPTSAGKTLVFMTNAALHVTLTGERSVMVFPTRVLNEDMFKRLTRLVHSLRQEFGPHGTKFQGGLLIGQSDPLFRALTRPQVNEPMIQYGACPECGNDRVVARLQGGRTVGHCEKCSHVVDYMFDPHETGAYLPNLVIATPDKLFHQATTASFEQYNLRFFGAKTVRCECGQYLPITPKTGATIECKGNTAIPGCGRVTSTAITVSSPVGYFVFDEVHSLYGLTATLLATFLDLITMMARIMGGAPLIPVYETGTATIANERELLSAITRRDESEIDGFPSEAEYSSYFHVDEQRVRYRSLVILPIAKSSLMATCGTLLHQYKGFHLKKDGLGARLDAVDPKLRKIYGFLLGYLYRKRDIFNTQHTLSDLYFQEYQDGSGLDGMDNLSGDSSPSQVAKIMQRALDHELKLLLANLVVSLGVDIEGLNNMVMFGFPGGMTEYVQTAGRTGRGDHPGHVTILLNPSRPRDLYLYNYFYQLLGDISGYYEAKPAEAAGVYAADIMAPNVVKGLLAADFLARKEWMWCRSVSRRLHQPDGWKQFLLTGLSVLAGPQSRSALGKAIFEDFQTKLLRWRTAWDSHPTYLSDWFKAEDLLLTSLRERAAKSVELHMADTHLYEALGATWAVPDQMGADDNAGTIDSRTENRADGPTEEV